MRKCSITSCQRAIYCKNICNMHWQRLRRNDTFTPKIIRGDDEKRFWSKVLKTNSCWLWQGNVQKDGYGVIGVGGKTLYAHRYSYVLAGYPLLPTDQLDHVVSRGCHSRACVNPNHLEPTTQRENVVRGKVHTGRRHKLPLGVSMAGKKYIARKRFDGREYRLGRFGNPEEAHQAYLLATKELYV